jgi:hypothetical protein
MSEWITGGNGHHVAGRNTGLSTRISIMAGATLILCGAIIVFFNRMVPPESYTEFPNSIALAANTLLPYMISAVVAAITAIGIITILPVLKGFGSARVIQDRLRDMAQGNLVSTLQLKDDSGQLRGLVSELNGTIRILGREIGDLKMINRHQWQVLEMIRVAAQDKDCASVLRGVELMEKNWDKIAEIEERLMTS